MCLIYHLKKDVIAYTLTLECSQKETQTSLRGKMCDI